MKKRPISVTVIAALLIVVGLVALVADFTDLGSFSAHPYETVLIPLVHLFAIVAGAFLLLGRNWARWLAVAWMVLHVAISYGHPLTPFIMHSVFLVIITYFLFRSDARAYFRRASESQK
jgi:hypothetical protein